MYGLLLESINFQITEKYGKEVWQQILEEADLKNYVFVTHRLYSEDLMFKLADGVIKVIGEEEDMIMDDVMRFFGVCFVKFFNHYGYDPIIRVSGRHLRDFLIGIDNLHEHMRFGYPKMQSPTFYCDEENSTGLNLHYLSRRKGFMFYVIGQIEEIARRFYNTYDINIKVLSNEREGSQCHIVYRLGFANVGYKPPSPDLLSVQPKKSITVDVFFTIFPFSFVISTDMTISMAGNGLISTLGRKVLGKNVREVFTLRRPKTEFTWQSLLTRKVVFELLSKIPVIRRQTKGKESMFQKINSQATLNTFPRSTSLGGIGGPSQSSITVKTSGSNSVPNQSTPVQAEPPPTLHLRGQMKYIKDWDKTIYICSPLIGSLDAMLATGLYMNDFSMHDTSQEMVLSGIKPLPQLEYARDQQFEQGRELEQCMEKLNKERQKSEELLYRMIPKQIAERLKQGESPINTCEYFDSVTVLFSYMDGFAAICTRVSAMQAVTLINNLFTRFDRLSETHNVYKFETLGDALYMAVSGAPVRTARHAEPVAAMALDMLNAVQKVKDPITKRAMTLTIGIHSGPVVAGLVGEMTLQYCLFGDTVNIASRLRTTALPMRIHISEQCRECLEGSSFEVEFRGVVELKGKGKMKTYWLIGQESHAIE